MFKNVESGVHLGMSEAQSECGEKQQMRLEK